MEPVRLRSIARPGVVLASLVVAALIAAGAFAAGVSLRQPEPTVAAGEPPLASSAQVERRSVFEGVRVVGQVVSPREAGLSVRLSAGGAGVDRLVVTRSVARPGDRIRPGDLVAEVSGRPVMAVPRRMPLYRDLTFGSSGADVRALQRMLSGLGYTVDAEDRLGNLTMDAVARWYADAGYRLEGRGLREKRLSWRELLPLPARTTTIVRAARVGAVLDERVPVITVRLGSPHVEIRADAAQIDAFTSTRAVYLTHEGKDYRAGITAIGELTTDAETGAASYPIRVRLPSKLARVPGLATLPVSTVRPADPSLAVPLIALHEDAAGRYVEVVPDAVSSRRDGHGPNDIGSGRPPADRVMVDVVAVAGGWAAIAEHPRLAEGTRLHVR